jgi:hypothetical protein
MLKALFSAFTLGKKIHMTFLTTHAVSRITSCQVFNFILLFLQQSKCVFVKLDILKRTSFTSTIGEIFGMLKQDLHNYQWNFSGQYVGNTVGRRKQEKWTYFQKTD